MKRVVIIGGGLAGINFIKKMAGDQRFQVTLIDRNNFHYFPPLLYQVGTAFIEASSISHPFRKMFQNKDNLRFHLGKLLRIDTANKKVETLNGILEYDILIVAVGTQTNFFGMEDVAKYSLPLKTIVDALSLRNRILLNMEKATRVSDLQEKKRLTNVVIGGGGPTGVEIAGVLSEMGRAITRKEYPELKNVQAHIYLIEAAPVLLGTMSEKAQKEACSQLEHLGVKIVTDTAVTGYKDGSVLLSNNTSIPTHSFIWTSGVIGREIPGLPEESVGRGRRLKVDEHLSVLNTDNVYAIGDISLYTADPDYPDGHPQLAQVAIQQARLLADNLKRAEEGKELSEFKYKDKGTMAIISKFNAVADLPKFFLKGSIAWLVWLLIHIIPIAGFRNKLVLAINWFWAFVTNDPTLRLIIGVYRRNK